MAPNLALGRVFARRPYNSAVTSLRTLADAILRPFRSEAVVIEAVQGPELPRATLWARFATALGADGLGPRALAGEVEVRVASRSGCAGRPGVNYASSLEAACDHRLWLLEGSRQSSESRLSAAQDDLDGAFGDRAAVDVARSEIESLRRRVWTAKELAPLARRYSLEAERLQAERDLAKLEPEPERARIVDAPVASGRMRAVHSFGDLLTADEAISKANARAVARSNAEDRTNDFTRARSALISVEIRVARWESENPRLAALLASEVSG